MPPPTPMAPNTYASYVASLRAAAPGGKLMQDEMPHVNALIGCWLARVATVAVVAASAPGTPLSRPAWTTAGLSVIGTREIPGPKHNPWIIAMWRKVGITWFNDDETAWCAGFQGWCMVTAGIAPPPPSLVAGAGNWAAWGEPCQPQVGAIAVKTRKGGNHVCQLVGITADGRYYLCLGGNQNNGVNITAIPVTTAGRPTFHAFRWPKGVPQLNAPLPIMSPETVSAATEA